MKNWFTSDTHFGHEKIIKYCKRPFTSVEEMNETLIANWNKVVAPQDMVYHLGDFAMGVEDKIAYAHDIRKRLNGNIGLVWGNHDPKCWRRGKNHPFSWVMVDHTIKIQRQTIVLYHYGMRTWWHDLRGVWHFYGHSHNQLPSYGKSIDVGVDKWNFTPVSFEELKAVVDTLPIGDHPMFEEHGDESH